MTKLKLIKTLLTIIVLILIFSGCAKKEQPKTNNNTKLNQDLNIATTTAATSTAEIDTSNWKTYKNEEYGFEFKYPEDWKQDNNNENSVFIFFKDKSKLLIFPKGGLDLGLPSNKAIEKNYIISGVNIKARVWNVNNNSFLVVYNILDKIPGWIKCEPSLNNCNRIELFTSENKDFNIFKHIIFTFKFNKYL